MTRYPSAGVDLYTESDLARDVDAFMEWNAFCVLRYSQHRRTTRQLAGHTDRVYVRPDLVVFCELKLPGNDLTEAERKWRERVLPFTGEHVWYVVWRSVEQAQVELATRTAKEVVQ